MDTVDLLAREVEFKKLNKQLQKKTESLMKEIEYVMQKPDVLSEYTSNLYSGRKKKNSCEKLVNRTPSSRETHDISIKKNTSLLESTSNLNLGNVCKPQKAEFENDLSILINNSGNGNIEGINCEKVVNCVCCHRDAKSTEDMEFLYAFVSVNVKDKVLPQSFMKNGVTVESVCKCLLAKIKLMQEQIDKLNNTITKKTSLCETHLTQIAEMESERLSLINKSNNMKSATADMKAKYGLLENKLEEKERLYKEVRSERDRHTAELKKMKSRNVSLEARCASQEETIGSLRQQLETSKKLEKELRECSRAMSASHETALSRSGARQRGAETCVRTQAALIDNLRRQVALLTTDGALKYLHDEYTKLLCRDF